MMPFSPKFGFFVTMIKNDDTVLIPLQVPIVWIDALSTFPVVLVAPATHPPASSILTIMPAK